MASANNMPRRGVLKAVLSAPLLMAAPAAALAAADPVDTPVMRLYREWEAVSKACDTVGREPETPENDAAYEALLEQQGNIETALMKAPCTCAADFAAKVIAWSSCGVYALPDERSDPTFWAEARALIA
jgi:hypothetical protein